MRIISKFFVFTIAFISIAWSTIVPCNEIGSLRHSGYYECRCLHTKQNNIHMTVESCTKTHTIYYKEYDYTGTPYAYKRERYEVTFQLLEDIGYYSTTITYYPSREKDFKYYYLELIRDDLLKIYPENEVNYILKEKK